MLHFSWDLCLALPQTSVDVLFAVSKISCFWHKFVKRIGIHQRWELVLFMQVEMAISASKIDLVSVVAELSSSYVVLGRLALAKPLEEDSVLCQIDSLSLIFDSQLLCSICNSTSVPGVFHTAEDGLLCEKCYNRKVFEPSSGTNTVALCNQKRKFFSFKFDHNLPSLSQAFIPPLRVFECGSSFILLRFLRCT